jgi:threonine synthase
MNYISTRDETASPKTFCDVVLEGLAPDGGLYVPQNYPQITEEALTAWRELSYPELAVAIFSLFVDDIPQDDLKRLVNATYTKEVFGSDEITPMQWLEHEKFGLLNVSNGPTLAFKDIAMQWLGHLFQYILERDQREMNILGATSGDTGSSAEYAMRGKKNINVFMLSPNKRMSPFQQAQMYSLDDPNIFNIAIEGTFDSCQDIVKAIGNDQQFKRDYHLGAVNSINWARVMAQIVYYFKAYLVAAKKISDPVDVVVPTGNFGNILAGHVAKQMGLPLRRLILATNENDVLDEFFKTGVYMPRPVEKTHATSSPSMDISKASNFERFIFDCVGRDAKALNALWAALAKGSFDINNAGHDVRERMVNADFVSGRSTHEDRIRTIRYVYKQYNAIIDPHTADGVTVGLEYRDENVPMICIETALPAKFEVTITEALEGVTPPRPEAYVGIEDKPKHFVVMENDVEQVKAFISEKCEM